MTTTSQKNKKYEAGQGGPAFNPESAREIYSKNITALTDVYKTVMETTQTIAQLQTQYMREMFEAVGGVIQEMGAPGGDSKKKMDQAQGAIRAGVDRAISHGKELTQALTKNRNDLTALLNKRINESAKEATEMFKRDKQK